MIRGGVLIWVQHLLGVGHLRRAAVLARAMALEGLDVTLVSGGMPNAGLSLDGVRFVQLEPVKASDARFSAIVDSAGRTPDAAFWDARRTHLLKTFEETAPRVVITEMFPFGRRAFSDEILALLEAAEVASPAPAVLASVRDVLTIKRKRARYVEMAERTLGYAADDRALATSGHQGTDEVIVSAGGGAVGAHLLQTAIAARPRTTLADHTWRLLTGENLSERDLAEIQASARPGIVVERARPDFPALLSGAAVSISQAGYNTVMDLIKARARAVLVPFVGEGETEQTLRAERLAARGWAQVLPEAALDFETLAAAVNAAWSAPRPPALAIDLSGAETTARIVAELVRE
jgi:predicted glycosyltransferase